MYAFHSQRYPKGLEDIPIRAINSSFIFRFGGKSYSRGFPRGSFRFISRAASSFLISPMRYFGTLLVPYRVLLLLRSRIVYSVKDRGSGSARAARIMPFIIEKFMSRRRRASSLLTLLGPVRNFPVGFLPSFFSLFLIKILSVIFFNLPSSVMVNYSARCLSSL